MRFKQLPVLLVGVVLLLVGGTRLLATDATSPAGAGVLLGAGLLILGIWVWSEMRD